MNCACASVSSDIHWPIVDVAVARDQCDDGPTGRKNGGFRESLSGGLGHHPPMGYDRPGTTSTSKMQNPRVVLSEWRCQQDR